MAPCNFTTDKTVEDAFRIVGTGNQLMRLIEPLDAHPNAVQAEARAVLVAGQHEIDEAGAVTTPDERECAEI